MYVDHQSIQRRVDPALDASSLAPSCNCCTSTLDGKKFGKLFPG
jgi:hypothetical protein